MKKLNFSSNNIKSIDILQKLNFPLLEYLYFENNKISSMEGLCLGNFQKLKHFNVTGNLISNIDILEKANFPDLEGCI